MTKKMNNPEKAATWQAFSRYKRRLDCFRTTGTSIVGVCITCNKRFQFGYLQAGHYISGRTNAVLFNLKFVNAQCPICNEVHHGKTKRYREVLVARHGEAYVDRWENKLKGMGSRGAISDRDINWVSRRKRYNRLYDKLMRDEGYKPLIERLQEGN